MRTIEQHAQALADGRTTSRTLVEQCLARIADPSGEGARAFIKVHAEQARAMADAMDALRRVGREPSRYAGIPVSLKDLFDIAGEPRRPARACWPMRRRPRRTHRRSSACWPPASCRSGEPT